MAFKELLAHEFPAFGEDFHLCEFHHGNVECGAKQHFCYEKRHIVLNP